MLSVYGSLMPLRILEEIRFWKTQEKEHTVVIRELVPALEPVYVQALKEWEEVFAKTEAAAVQWVEWAIRTQNPNDPFLQQQLRQLIDVSTKQSVQFIEFLRIIEKESKPVSSNPVVKTVIEHIIRESEYFLGTLKGLETAQKGSPYGTGSWGFGVPGHWPPGAHSGLGGYAGQAGDSGPGAFGAFGSPGGAPGAPGAPGAWGAPGYYAPGGVILPGAGFGGGPGYSLGGAGSPSTSIGSAGSSLEGVSTPMTAGGGTGPGQYGLYSVPVPGHDSDGPAPVPGGLPGYSTGSKGFAVPQTGVGPGPGTGAPPGFGVGAPGPPASYTPGPSAYPGAGIGPVGPQGPWDTRTEGDRPPLSDMAAQSGVAPPPAHASGHTSGQGQTTPALSPYKPVPIGGHKLPPLPYAYNALEPHIDEATMREHHDKHHKAYVDDLNKAEQMLAKARDSGDFALVKHWERELAFNGAGHYLHTIFWNIMKPNGGGKAYGPIAAEINKSFGSYDRFKKQFTEAAKKVEGGGWAILVWSPRSHRLEILQAEKHQNLSQWDVIPLLVLDVWEHAYYLKHKSNRAQYIEDWWKVVNWDHVNERFEPASKLTWLPY
ncbi:Fe-Mn family superoxide dismutase [Paenibacillus chitinolyticus]